MIYEILKFICLLAGLVPATYFDIKYREIPIFIMPLSLIGATIFNILYALQTSPDLKIFSSNLIISGIIFTVAMFFLAKGKLMGGADVIMVGAIAFSLGVIRTIEIIIIACIVGVIYALIKKKKKGLPFAPFLLIGTGVDLGIMIFI